MVAMTFLSLFRSRHASCSLVVLVCTLMLSKVQPVWAVEDPLQVPAMDSRLVNRALMLDSAKAGKRLVAVGERGFVRYSDDSGESWHQASVPVREMLTAVQFINDQQGWAVGHSGVVLHSKDAGSSWKLVLDGNRINEIQVSGTREWLDQLRDQLEQAGDEAVREALELAIEEAEYALGDAESFVDEGASRPLLGLWFESPERGYLFGAFGLMLRTVDGGASWQSWSVRVPNPDGFHFYAMAKMAGKLYLAGEAGTLYRSDDRGETWQVLDLPYEGSLFGMSGRNGTLIVVGMRGNAYRSIDGGESWEKIETGLQSSLSDAIWLSDQRVVLLGYGGQTLVSDDAGLSIRSRVSAGGLPVVAGTLLDDQLFVVGPGGVRQIPLKKLNEG